MERARMSGSPATIFLFDFLILLMPLNSKNTKTRGARVKHDQQLKKSGAVSTHSGCEFRLKKNVGTRRTHLGGVGCMME